MPNNLIMGFLEDENNRYLYECYLEEPSDKNKEKVEEAFHIYAMKIKILSYFSRVFFFEAQRFDKKVRQNNTLPLLDDDDDECINIELIHSYEELSGNLSLENYFEDERLSNIVSKLNENNKKLLYLLYIKEFDEAQVAAKLGITKQAVNKRKNNLLKKIKKLYFD